MQEINNFEDDLKYKLYSNLNKIMHPSISKKNISSYKIVLKEDISLVRVFYPLKVSNLNKVIIYIHGISSVSGCGNHYSDICMNIALKTKQLVIAVDYDEHKRYLECLKDIAKCVKFISDELNLLGIDNNSITLMGDSIGATMAYSVSKMLGDIKRNILIITASNDYLKEEAYQFSEFHSCDILELTVGGHGFLKNMSLDIENIFYIKILEFLEK